MKPNISAKERLIVALDVDTEKEALDIVEKLGDDVSFYKVGWQLFMRTHFNVVEKLQKLKKKVFLDLKMTDIGTTIESALKNLPNADFIELMTLSGAKEVLNSARKATKDSDTMFLMLTELSSVDDDDIKELYGDEISLEQLINYRVGKALEAHCDGLIASGDSIQRIRKQFSGSYIIVAPGIRPKGFPIDEHKRSLTPYEAILNGADYLVVGRPITQQSSDDPGATARSIIEEIKKALDDKAATKSKKANGNNGPMAATPMAAGPSNM